MSKVAVGAATRGVFMGVATLAATDTGQGLLRSGLLMLQVRPQLIDHVLAQLRNDIADVRRTVDDIGGQLDTLLKEPQAR